jgi:hypothetical protein
MSGKVEIKLEVMKKKLRRIRRPGGGELKQKSV